MMRICKWLTAAMACVALTLGVAAADVLPFQDIDADSPWYEAVTYAAANGIVQGTGDGRFCPDEHLTARQWAIMLCRAYGREGIEMSDTLFGQAERSAADGGGGLDVGSGVERDTRMCRAAVIHSVFAVEDVPVYPYELYEGGAAIPEAENYIRVGWENGLCEKDADPLEPVTRGEAVQILYLARKYGLKTETPEVVEKWKIQNNDGVHLGPFLLEFQKVPAAILEEYVRSGWVFRVDSRAVDALSEELNMSCAGMTNYREKIICVKLPTCVIHEFGHFYHHFIGAPAVIDELYLEESDTASKVLGEYSATDAREYFAEFFEFWIDWSGNEMKMRELAEAAPETFAYFLTLKDLEP